MHCKQWEREIVMTNSSPYSNWQNAILQEIRGGEEFDLRRTWEEFVALGAGSGVTLDDFPAMVRSGCDAEQLVDAAVSGRVANST